MKPFLITDETPMAALSVGQFRELLISSVKPQPIQPQQHEEYPETFGKKVCSLMTGYAVNTINKMICERQIPYYKKRGKVLFKREEIREWMLSNRVSTIDEYVEAKECQLAERRTKR